jgi:membrane protease YdiL (CAAX protease family)
MATITAAVLMGVLTGGLSFQFNRTATIGAIVLSLAQSFAVFAAAAAFEEAFFRGYLLQTFARSGLAWPAIVLTSVLFGAVHLQNPDAGIISTANTALAGLWFGCAYLKTRDLWFPFGIHLMWNWFQGSIFGIEVSGIRTISANPLLLENDRGPQILTGSAYGIEAALPATLAILVSIAVIQFSGFIRPNEELLAMTEPASPATRSVS